MFENYPEFAPFMFVLTDRAFQFYFEKFSDWMHPFLFHDAKVPGFEGYVD